MSGHEPNQPRQPRDMNDLLRYCAEVGSTEGHGDHDVPAPHSHVEPISEERKEWLSRVLQDITVDHVAALREHLSVVNSSSHDIDTREDAFEELFALCENVDFAKDFHKIGGYSVFTDLFSDSNPIIRAHACELVAVLVQNNDYCQHEALEAGWMSRLMALLDDDPSNEVKVKALYALSCLVRNNSAAQVKFSHLDGFSVVLRAMHTGVDKLKVKAAFLLTSLITQQPAYIDTLCDIGMVEQLAGNLREGHSATHEHFMSALLALVSGNERAVAESRRPELNLRTLLHERVVRLEGREEFMEEMQYARRILDICFGNEETGQDR